MKSWPDEALERQMLADADHVMSHANEGSSAADCGCHVRALLDRVRELEQRVTVLRAALMEIAENKTGDASDRAFDRRDIARAALKGTSS